MNDLVNLLKGLAPTLATAVAGPLGGAAVSAIASKFGVSDSVEAVAKAIAGDPAAAQKLAEMELEYYKIEQNNLTDRLKADIKEYRGKITQYATENKDRLCGEFGDRDVERFLQKFSNKDQDEWTSDIALFCASKVYGRPIVVYSRAGTTFATDDRGQLKPSGRFPKGEVAAAGAVISLVFWDNAHYALLEGKESTSPST